MGGVGNGLNTCFAITTCQGIFNLPQELIKKFFTKGPKNGIVWALGKAKYLFRSSDIKTSDVKELKSWIMRTLGIDLWHCRCGGIKLSNGIDEKEFACSKVNRGSRDCCERKVFIEDNASSIKQHAVWAFV